MLEDPPKPNPECKVCQTITAMVNVDFKRAKLNDLLEIAIIKGASLDIEEVTVMNGNK